MEVTVNMSAAEFGEFMEYRADKERYERGLQRIRRIQEAVTTSLRFAVEPLEGKEGKYKIVSQEHMADVMDMVEEFTAKKQKKPPAPGADNTAQVAMGTAETVRLSTL